MITCMFKIICVTNRNICEGDFLERIDAIGREKADALILREKDLSEEQYEKLARAVLDICKKNQLPCILHSFSEVAKRLNHPAIHLPLTLLRNLTAEEKVFFTCLGASCHSVEEAEEAEALGCTYITAGHIFETDCKKGLPGRGTEFLKAVCESVSVPVYAIGGIRQNHLEELQQAGAAGACSMSGFMKKDGSGF